MESELFLQQFGHLAQGEGGIKKLRDLILQLAVRGKLVEQDPNDEPASELLNKIETKKKELVKEKKIRKQAAYPRLEQSDWFSTIPENWMLIHFGEIGDWGAGATPNRKNSEYYDGDMPWFKSGELNGAVITSSEESITEKALQECSLRLNQVGDVVVAMYGATIGKTAVVGVPSTTNQAVCACTPFEGVYNKYLHIVLKAYKPVFTGQGAGGAQPNISRIKIINTPFPLPPLAEQKWIVAKVDELMALCDRLEAEKTEQQLLKEQATSSTLHHLSAADAPEKFSQSFTILQNSFNNWFDDLTTVKKLRATILQLAVQGKLMPQDSTDEPASELLKRIEAEKKKLIASGTIKKPKLLPPIRQSDQPFALPRGWEWVRLEKCSIVITSGSRDWAKYYSSDGAIFVRMGNLAKDDYRMRLGILQHVQPPATGEGTRTRLEQDDLLISITGDVGMFGLIPSNFGEAYINQHTALLRLFPDFRNRYIAEYLRSPLAKEQFNAPQRGIKNSFRLGDIGEMLLPLPPLNEQKRIVAKVDELMQLCDQLEASISQTSEANTHLMDSLIHHMTKAA